MTKQMIEVEVPEGMEIDKTTSHIVDENIYMIRLQKIQPRRIVLEETETTCNYEETQEFKIGNNSIAVWSTKVLREVKETAIPLHSEEPKLSN